MVSRGNAESEYKALASLTVEIVWIWCDNRSVASLAANPVFHALSKHIEIDLHFIRDKVLQGDLKIQYIPIAQQVADVFTKHLSSAQFLLFRTQLSIVPRLVHLWGDDNSSHSQLKEVTHNISLKPPLFFLCLYKFCISCIFFIHSVNEMISSSVYYISRLPYNYPCDYDPLVMFCSRKILRKEKKIIIRKMIFLYFVV